MSKNTENVSSAAVSRFCSFQIEELHTFVERCMAGVVATNDFFNVILPELWIWLITHVGRAIFSVELMLPVYSNGAIDKSWHANNVL